MGISTHFVNPQRALLKVPIAVKLMMHERVPAVGVDVAGLLGGEIAGRETADLRPCRINKYCSLSSSANTGNRFVQPLLILVYQNASKQTPRCWDLIRAYKHSEVEVHSLSALHMFTKEIKCSCKTLGCSTPKPSCSTIYI